MAFLPPGRLPTPNRFGVGLAVIVLVAQLAAISPVKAATDQTIVFEPNDTGRVGDVVTMDAAADSGLPIAYATTTPTLCTVDGSDLHLDAVGSCSVTASQAGDATYAPAPDETRSIEVLPALLPQTISFSLPGAGLIGGTVAVSASSDSGLTVSLAVTTPTKCSIVGQTLRLDHLGACIVTASQAGDDVFLPAPDVARTIDVRRSPITTPGQTNLGRYAYNGSVRSIDVDRSTGITYVGGAFSRMGIRTGSVAVVDPPDSGSDDVKAASPDVVGTQVGVLPHDATGYFVTGDIASINGDGVHRFGAVRMTSAGTIDPTWTYTGMCFDGTWPMWDLGTWLAARVPIDTGGQGLSTVGLQLVDKATGKAYLTGAGVTSQCGSSGRMWPTSTPAAPGGPCAAPSSCQGFVESVAFDQTSHRLVTLIQLTGGRFLVAYDLVTGARQWSVQVNGDVTNLSIVGPSVLVVGEITQPGGEAYLAKMMRFDAADGTLRQRWSALGEEDPTDPSQVLGPTTSCLPADDVLRNNQRFLFAKVDATTVIGYGLPSGDPVRDVPVCRYRSQGSGGTATFVATEIGTLQAHPDAGLFYDLPSTLYKGRYLVGGYDAFDLQTATQVAAWRPDPSLANSLSVVTMGSSVVFGGAFTFLHGVPANHVAALDADLAPIPGFLAELPDTDRSASGIQDVFAVRLLGDRLIVAGDLKGDFGRGPVVALDKVSGDVLWARGTPSIEVGLALATDAETDTFYLGLDWIGDDPALARYRVAGSDFEPDPDWTPTLGVLDGTGPSVLGLDLIDDELYVGGQFGSIDGQDRQGLARFDADGDLDTWAPALVDLLDPPDGANYEIQPHAFLVLDDRVIVAGIFNAQNGSHSASPIVVFGKESGARLLPVGSPDAWFPIAASAQGYALATAGDMVYVALGPDGVAAFDQATFDYVPTHSFRSEPGWGNEIYALALRENLQVSAVGSTMTMVVAGQVPSWEDRSAGNVLELVAYDTAPPTVTSRTPASGATKVARDANIGVSFSEAIAGGKTGVTLWDVETDKKVAVVATYNVATHRVVLDPTALLAAGHRFRVRLSSAIVDSWDNHLAASSWLFTVSTDQTRPRITARSPSSGATGISRTRNVVVTFSERVKVSATTIRLRDVSTGTYVTAVVTLSSSKRTATLNPTGTLKSRHSYKVVISGVTDLAGNRILTTGWTYKTGS